MSMPHLEVDIDLAPLTMDKFTNYTHDLITHITVANAKGNGIHGMD
jgi:hypothetical protein